LGKRSGEGGRGKETPQVRFYSLGMKKKGENNVVTKGYLSFQRESPGGRRKRNVPSGLGTRVGRSSIEECRKRKA